MNQQLEEILARYKGEKGDLIPLLQEVQTRFGYLPEEAMQGIAKFLRLSESTVYGVSTFYAQFKLTPTGRHTIKVCRGTACHVRGGKAVLKKVMETLGIEDGETTEDMKFTIETVACLGACVVAPVMVVNSTYYGKMTSRRVEGILVPHCRETAIKNKKKMM